MSEEAARLALEQRGADLFDWLYTGQLRHFAFTVIVFDFTDEQGNHGHVAFKTSLPFPALVETAVNLVTSFEGGPARYAPRGMSEKLLRAVATRAKNKLPPRVGYALIIGDPSGTAYASNAERPNVLELLKNELLPKWRERI